MDVYRSLLKKMMEKIQAWIKKIIEQEISLQTSYKTKVEQEKQERGSLWKLHVFCKWIGKPVPLFSMLFAIGGLGSLIIGPKALILEAAAYLCSQIINFRLKAIYRRSRPPTTTFSSPFSDDKFSFPSGHAAGTMSIAVCMSAFIPGSWIVLFPWSFMMGLSRYFGDYHYPSDIIVGFLIGIVSGYLTFFFVLLLNLF
jgi:membrane-associated phospholipid phosphatase